MQSLATVVGNPRFKGTEVTVRCRVDNEGFERRGRIHYPVRNIGSQLDEECYATFWKESPEDVRADDSLEAGDFAGTNAPIVKLIEEVPLRTDEELLIRGIVRQGDRLGWHINTTSILLRDPTTRIGKNEMRTGRQECPRIYDLRYNKNVISSHDFANYLVKGNVVHKAVEYAIGDPDYRQFFETEWSEVAVSNLAEEVLDENFGFKMALGHLAWDEGDVQQMRSWVTDALKTLFSDEDFCELVAGAAPDDVQTERVLPDTTGLRGRIDLLVENTPYELKTSRSQHEKHRFQVKVYLTGLLLMDLSPGESIETALEKSTDGYILYTSLRGESGLKRERVELTYDDVVDILMLRNNVVNYRSGAAGADISGFGVPTTYGRHCDGCGFRKGTYITSDPATGTPDLAPPCQYYCQSERRWPCQEFDDDGNVESSCPLYTECDQRLEFRNPDRTDHFNELRSAINAEQTARSHANRLFDTLDADTLEASGLLLRDLTPAAVYGNVVAYETSTAVVPGFVPGEKVTLRIGDSELGITATYYGSTEAVHRFKFEGTPPTEFTSGDTVLRAERSFEEDGSLRDLLQYLDFAQRSDDTFAPDLLKQDRAGERGTGTETPLVTQLEPDRIGVVADQLASETELVVNLPVRSDRERILRELLNTVIDSGFQSGTGETIPEEDTQTLVLARSPQQLNRLSASLAERSEVITIDEGTQQTVGQRSDGPDPEEFKESIRESQGILSTASFALSSRLFQHFEAADRPHSPLFFDTVVLLGAEKLTEPEYLFLDHLAESSVAIGDIHRSGPEFISEEGQMSDLSESYFTRAFQRYRSVDAETTFCYQFRPSVQTGRRPLHERTDHPEGSTVPGNLRFDPVQGDEEMETMSLTFTRQLPIEEALESYEIRLRLVDNGDAIAVPSALEELQSLNPTTLRSNEILTIGDLRFEVEQTLTKGDTDEHRIVVQAPIADTAFFTERLLRNPAEADRTIALADDLEPDIIVTPFRAQASLIRERLDDRDLSIPVLLPSSLPGQPFDSGIVSMVSANREARVHPPLDRGNMLYTLLTAADDLTVIGDEQTLKQNRLLRTLLE